MLRLAARAPFNQLLIRSFPLLAELDAPHRLRHARCLADVRAPIRRCRLSRLTENADIPGDLPTVRTCPRYFSLRGNANEGARTCRCRNSRARGLGLCESAGTN